MSNWYRLGADRNPVPVDFWAGAASLERGGDDRRVALTKLADCEVSTVFLALDHQFGDGPPILFETLVFGGPFGGEQDRYSTWAEAEAGHERMVQRVRPGVWRRLRAWWHHT